MKWLKIIVQLAVLFLFNEIGKWLVEALNLVLPGSIMGLILLWLCLFFNIIKVEWIEAGAGFLLMYLTLFFIPTTIGVIDYPELLSGAGLYLMLAVVISTLFAIAVAGVSTKYLEKKERAMKGVRE
ncbi:MAG: CidA/LrgA family holin-like protein [Caryophanon sp.]|nr:CidA/LrgA family holin-like protein [Caryophanon sp.]